MEYQTYDSFGNKTEIIKSTWDVSKANWKFFSKQINNYNSNNIATLLSTYACLLYTSPSPRDRTRSRMPSSA